VTLRSVTMTCSSLDALLSRTPTCLLSRYHYPSPSTAVLTCLKFRPLRGHSLLQLFCAGQMWVLAAQNMFILKLMLASHAIRACFVIFCCRVFLCCAHVGVFWGLARWTRFHATETRVGRAHCTCRSARSAQEVHEG
jgi:hypothetical protein